MVGLDIFISCGNEVARHRDIANRVLRALERSLSHDLRIPVVIRTWDYRDEPPEVVKRGDLAARSLRMVGSSSAVLAILGREIPPIASQEILKAVREYTAGRIERVWVFVERGARGSQHAKFFETVRKETDMEIVFQEFSGDLDFQEKAFSALLSYVVQKAVLERRTVVEPASRISA